jgi:DNA-directed RNA polymerase subunit N
MSTFPIRCFTCGKLINHRWKEYENRVQNDEDPRMVLDDFKLERMCCRRMFMTHATAKLEEYQLMYPSTIDRIERIGPKEDSFKNSRARTEAIANSED